MMSSFIIFLTIVVLPALSSPLCMFSIKSSWCQAIIQHQNSHLLVPQSCFAEYGKHFCSAKVGFSQVPPTTRKFSIWMLMLDPDIRFRLAPLVPWDLYSLRWDRNSHEDLFCAEPFGFRLDSAVKVAGIRIVSPCFNTFTADL